jgi:ketosteroid isomerase-like protein
MTESTTNLPGTRHIETVQALYAAFQAGDVIRILGFLAPDVVWSEPANPFNPAAGTRHGHAGFLQWLQIGQAAEEIVSLEPQRFLVDDSSVAVVGRSSCRARETGREYDTDFVHLIVFRDGKVVRFQEFFDTYAAGEAFRP